MSGPGEEPGCPMEETSYECCDNYDPMTEMEGAVDKAVADIFRIFGEQLGLSVGGSLAKNIGVRVALDELLARQESMFLDQQTCQWHQHHFQLAQAKVAWFNRRAYLEQFSIAELTMRKSAEHELAATAKRLEWAEKAYHQLLQRRAELLPPDVDVPEAPSAILLGNTHLRACQETKKASESAEPSGDSTIPAAESIAEEHDPPRNPHAQLVWSQDPSPDDTGRRSLEEDCADGAEAPDWERARASGEEAAMTMEQLESFLTAAAF